MDFSFYVIDGVLSLESCTVNLSELSRFLRDNGNIREFRLTECNIRGGDVEEFTSPKPLDCSIRVEVERPLAWITSLLSSLNKIDDKVEKIWDEDNFLHAAATFCRVGNFDSSLGDINYSTNSRGWTLLHLGAKEGNDVIVKSLLGKGANVNITGGRVGRVTPLHLAVRNGHLNVVKVLIDALADVNRKTRRNYTSLHLAAQNGHLDVVEFLIDKNSDVSAKTQEGYTPLHLAAQNGHLDVVKYLISEKGAEIDLRGHFQLTPLHLAAQNGSLSVVKVLLAMAKEPDCSPVTRRGHTPLHLAAACGNKTVVELLLSKGKAKIDLQSHIGFTPLHLAARNGHLNVVKVLIDKNAKTTCDDTALHLAAQNGHLNVVEFLIGKNSDISAKTQKGCTPLELALLCSHYSVGNFLLEQGAQTSTGINNNFVRPQLASKDVNQNDIKFSAKDEDFDCEAYGAIILELSLFVKYISYCYLQINRCDCDVCFEDMVIVLDDERVPLDPSIRKNQVVDRCISLSHALPYASFVMLQFEGYVIQVAKHYGISIKY